MRTLRIAVAALSCLLLWGAGWAPNALADEVVHDEAGRIVVEIDTQGGETHYAYHPNGEIRRIAYPDGSVEEFDEQGNPANN